jgi:hypothetical protein
MLARIDQIARDDVVFQGRAGAVDIAQIEVQRRDALGEAALDDVPFRMRNDARDQIEGEEALGAAAVAVDGERDALNEVRKIGQFAALLECIQRHVREVFIHGRGAGPRLPVGGNQFVVKAPRIVAGEEQLVRRMYRRGGRHSGPLSALRATGIAAVFVSVIVSDCHTRNRCSWWDACLGPVTEISRTCRHDDSARTSRRAEAAFPTT